MVLSSQKDVLKSDLVVCSVAAVLSFAVSASTVFLSLRVRTPSPVLHNAGARGGALGTHRLVGPRTGTRPGCCEAHRPGGGRVCGPVSHGRRPLASPPRLGCLVCKSNSTSWGAHCADGRGTHGEGGRPRRSPSPADGPEAAGAVLTRHQTRMGRPARGSSRWRWPRVEHCVCANSPGAGGPAGEGGRGCPCL